MDKQGDQATLTQEKQAALKTIEKATEKAVKECVANTVSNIVAGLTVGGLVSLLLVKQPFWLYDGGYPWSALAGSLLMFAGKAWPMVFGTGIAIGASASTCCHRFTDMKACGELGTAEDWEMMRDGKKYQCGSKSETTNTQSPPSEFSKDS